MLSCNLFTNRIISWVVVPNRTHNLLFHCFAHKNRRIWCRQIARKIYTKNTHTNVNVHLRAIVSLLYTGSSCTPLMKIQHLYSSCTEHILHTLSIQLIQICKHTHKQFICKQIRVVCYFHSWMVVLRSSNSVCVCVLALFRCYAIITENENLLDFGLFGKCVLKIRKQTQFDVAFILYSVLSWFSVWVIENIFK